MNQEASDFWERSRRALASARVLSQSDPEGSASRAYYAAFYAASAVFAKQGRTFSRHSAIRAAVHRDLVKPGQWSPELGEAYSFLFELRFIADYGSTMRVSGKEAEKAIDSALTILQAVHEKDPGNFPLPGDGAR